MTILEEAASGLLILLRAEVVGFETLVEVAQKLSAHGVSRTQIMELYYGIMRDHANELEEPVIDMIGDVNIHLSGQQCPINQIIRLTGDPEDPLELYESVRQQMSDWRPPK